MCLNFVNKLIKLAYHYGTLRFHYSGNTAELFVELILLKFAIRIIIFVAGCFKF